MKDQLGLQRCPETLHGSVVKAVSSSAHGGFDPQAFEHPSILLGAILAALIRVMQKTRGRLCGFDRPQQRLHDQIFGHAPAHGVTDDFPRAQLLVPDQVEPALIGGHIGVSSPGESHRAGLSQNRT